MSDFYSFCSFYGIQRVVVIILFILCTYNLVFVSQRYRRDMNYNNIYVTKTLRRLDAQGRERAGDTQDSGTDCSDDVECKFVYEEPPAKRVFKSVLPLTSLERRQYIEVNRLKYLRCEMLNIYERFLTFAWITFLFVTICYFDLAIIDFLKSKNATTIKDITIKEQARFGIALTYMFIALLNVILEPLITRTHQNVLEEYYPQVAKRRARILMMTINLQRKAFIKINQLNIYLRFNKTGNMWTVLRSFVEESVGLDFLSFKRINALKFLQILLG